MRHRWNLYALHQKQENRHDSIVYFDEQLILCRYNQRVKEWESEGAVQLENVSFYISYRNITKEYDLVTKGFGEFYPFRDSCDKMSDPKCLSSTVSYFSASLPILYDQDSVVLISSVDGSTVFNETVQFQDTIYLNKKEIGCSGGNTFQFIFPC